MITMINFFKKYGEFILMLLMFPVLWPVYVVHELVSSNNVTHNTCTEAWNLWVCGTLTYCVVCAMLWGIYKVALMICIAGWFIPSLMVIAAASLLIFVHISAPKILYYILKNKKIDE